MFGGFGGFGNCLDDGGYISGEATRAGALVAAANLISGTIAALMAKKNADQLIQNFKKKYRIQKELVAIEEEQQEHLREVYWPKELAFLEEFANPDEIETAEQYGRRHAGRLISTVAAAFAREIQQFKCNAPRYCTSYRVKGLQDLHLTYAQAVANARILGRVMGFIDVQRKKDLAFGRRLQAIGIGKGLMGKAAELYAGAVATLDQLGQELSGQLSDSLTGLGKAFEGFQKGVSMMRSGNNGYSTEPVYGISKSLAGTNTKMDDLNSFLDTLQPDPTDFESSNLIMQNSPAAAPQNQYGGDAARGLSNEGWNEGDVGNRDLARTGSYTYHTTGYSGYPIQLTVSMSDFNFEYVDSQNPGDS